MLFFDTNLSTPPGQSCAACHAPEWGFTGPASELNAAGAVYPGAVHTRFGNRKPPSSAYGGESPVLFYDEVEEVWIGGMFWDGRATGWTLGDPLAEQAQGPFLNALEQNNPNPRLVCIKVSQSSYADLFEEVWGPGSLDFVGDVAGTYERIARSISAYEKSEAVNPFTSKFDIGRTYFTAEEEWGLELYNDPAKGNCAACHPSEPGDFDPDHALFTDFTYDNLGIPRNPENPFYSMPPKWNPDGPAWVDPGLGGFLARTEFEEHAAANYGKHKVPALRNVAAKPAPELVKAFGHNGYFKSLKDIVHFYNTRDVEPWPAPEVPENVNHDELGNLGLTDEEEDAIVAFLETLTDGFEPPSPLVPGGSWAPSLALDMRVYPNPLRADGLIEWVNESPTTALRLYNAAGRLVLRRDVTGNRISWRDLSGHRNLPSGVYFLRAGGFEQAPLRIIVNR
jgi:cytochrome c peroxidase